MPHEEVDTAANETRSSADNPGDETGIVADIVRAELVDGNIRVRCPVDLAELEVPAGQARVVCEIGGENLIIKVQK